MRKHTRSPSKFERMAPWVMQALIDRYQLKPFQAAGPLGNFGRETDGFLALRERAFANQPNRGGWGWAQWTGRRASNFHAWCAEHHLDWRSDGANLGFLLHELDGDFAHVVKGLRGATTLRGAVITFETHYEMAGVPAMDERIRWAQIALRAYQKNGEDDAPQLAGTRDPRET